MKINKYEFLFSEVKSLEKFNVIIEDIFYVVSKTLVGLKESDIRDIIQQPSNVDVRAMLMRHGNKTVGFVIVQRIDVTIENKVISVFQSVASVLPKYRTVINLSSYVNEVALKHKFCFPFREIFCLGFYTSPSIYDAFQKDYYEFYLTVANEMPKNCKKVIDYLIQEVEKNKSSLESSIALMDNSQFSYFTNVISKVGYKDHCGICILIPFSWQNIGMSILKKMKAQKLLTRERIIQTKNKTFLTEK
ncbi:hypothetical protein [Agarilytica rhodophyticola]|uniref:hypothetical protein n=1 Tax=Agarilytica rhodophyticola TaxID=1737490 RepID=UPI000CD96082|nr:hypothetical protein [Agarilytica rhodophyticola]